MKRNVHSYTVTGMDCPDCAVHLEKRINALEGVQNAKVNFFKSTISVNHIDKFNESELKKAVRQAGYSLNGKAEYQNKSLLFFVVFSGLALLLGYAISYFIGK